MKYPIFLCLMLLILSVGESALGQTSAQELAGSLRMQLSEIETKQAALQTRLQEIDEKMKPESIERSLAGVGSTKPEELREQKRRQFEIERSGVQKQLDLLAASRTRLEASIARADAEAYRQSAAPQPMSTQVPTVERAPGPPAIEVQAPPVLRRHPRKRRVRRVRRTHHAQRNIVLGARVLSPVMNVKSNPVPAR